MVRANAWVMGKALVRAEAWFGLLPVPWIWKKSGGMAGLLLGPISGICHESGMREGLGLMPVSEL